MSERLSKPNIFILQNRWDTSVFEEDVEEVGYLKSVFENTSYFKETGYILLSSTIFLQEIQFLSYTLVPF